MKRYAILRALEPTTTRADLDVGAMQALINLSAPRLGLTFEPRFGDVDWIRSYWHEGSTWGMCLYIAPDPTQVADYHAICEVPYVEFREVSEFTAAGVAVDEAGTTALAEGESLFTIEAAVEANGSVTEATFAALPLTLTQSAGGLEGALDHIRLIRAYWDGERRRTLALYATAEAATVGALTQLLSGSGVVVRPVVEITPGEYLG